jgi:hypothetical protein
MLAYSIGIIVTVQSILSHQDLLKFPQASAVVELNSSVFWVVMRGEVV